MLKVLQLIPTLDRSGAEKQMVMLAKGLPRDRFRVEVAALTRSGPLAAELNDAGIPVTVIGKPLKLDPIALARLARFLKAGVVRRGPDLDLRGQHLWAGRVAAGAGAGGRRGGDGRGPVEGRGRPARSTAGWRRGATGWSATRTPSSTSTAGLGVPDDRLAMIYSGVDDEEPPAVDPRAVRAEFGFAGRCADGPVRRPAGRAEAGGRPA